MSAWEQRCLGYDPFAGDKDDGGWRLLSDTMRTARRSGVCATCRGAITPGMRVRAMTAVGDGRVVTTRDCEPCCRAMAQWMRGCEGPLLERITMARDANALEPPR